MAEQFEFLNFDDEEEAGPQILWIEEGKEKILDLFRKVFRFYTKEEGEVLDTRVIIAVLEEENLPITESLQDIKDIWFGYLSVILELKAAQNEQRSQ